MLVSAFIFITYSISISDANYDKEDSLKDERYKYTWRFAFWGLFAIFVSIFFPGLTAVKLIIASEVSDRVLHIQDVADPASEYIKAWLEKQTKDLQK